MEQYIEQKDNLFAKNIEIKIMISQLVKENFNTKMYHAVNIASN